MNGRPWLADQLTAAGVQVDTVISYERSAPVFDAAELALLRQASTDQSIWLLSSSEAVANLTQFQAELRFGLELVKARAIATHPRIAQAARDAGFGVVYESRPLLGCSRGGGFYRIYAMSDISMQETPSNPEVLASCKSARRSCPCSGCYRMYRRFSWFF